MTLRTRLIVAFLLMSVLPLSAVTLYSYTSSLQAFQRAVEAEAGETAKEMGRRMEIVTADLGRRVERMQDLPVTSGVTFGLARQIGRSLRDIRRASIRNLLLGLTVIGLAVVGIVPVSARMTRNLSALTDGARRIARGDFNTRVTVRSPDEFGQLAQAFNQMAQDLEQHQQLLVERERMRRELELSRQIQTEMLPSQPLRFGLTEVKGISIPAREVGGDFFNYFPLPDGTLALLVGDVSGKGVSAALLISTTRQ